MAYSEKKVLVLGMGKTGRAVDSFLRSKGADVVSYDDKECGFLGDILCDNYDFVVVSPGFSPKHSVFQQIVARGIPILSELDLAYIHCKSSDIFAVSGTNGKTTTCTILKEMLSETVKTYLVGNIGTPFIKAVDSIETGDAVVVEVSSFQSEQSTLFRPAIAALTNVGEDHLDRHGTAGRYREIKLDFVRRAKLSVLNGDDPEEEGIIGVRYSLNDPKADYRMLGRRLFARNGEYSLPFLSRGEAFDRDFLCAFAVACEAFGAREEYLRAYEKTELPLFRNQYVGDLVGAKVYNDSKGTNIDATLFAIAQTQGETALILGGSDKGENYTRLMQGLFKIKRVYLVGANAADLYLAADEETRKKCLLMADLESCVADFVAHPLKTLLFSPASASFDFYENYEERGRVFNEIVRKFSSGR